MRRQDWAFLVVVGGFMAAVVTLLGGQPGWAGACALVAIGAAAAARAWSRSYPGPMSHALSWLLRLPRGFHSPTRLCLILEPRPGERVLEAGPGIGVHALPVAAAIAPDGVLDAVDIQEEMVRDLSTRAERAGVTNIVALHGDATELSYADATFDGIFLLTVLGEMPDQNAALGELRRVIKPTGRLVVGEMFIDPDFISLPELQDRARHAGFALECRQGPRFAYFARFRPT